MTQSPNHPASKCSWTARSRLVIFFLAASSIACLLADFYNLCPMKLFTPFIFLPALILLGVLGLLDRARGDGHVWRAVWMGLLGGFLAALAYDVFRLPFVFASQWGIDSVIPPMNLYKVFPRFGAMVLGEPIEQSQYSMTTQIVGWIYHFSNGATFGVMYLALIGDPRRRHWSWAILFAVTIELGMLLTPYPKVFNIAVTGAFIVVTMMAHAIYGLGLGLFVRSLSGDVKAAPENGSASIPST